MRLPETSSKLVDTQSNKWLPGVFRATVIIRSLMLELAHDKIRDKDADLAYRILAHANNAITREFL